MSGSEFYIWQARTHTARIALDLIDKINAVLNDPRTSRGEECGGILLGCVREPNSVELCGFELIRSEHHRGTIFGLGLREQQRVSRHVGGLSKRKSLRPVGFFRTHLRPGLYLDQDDFSLMQEAFGDPSDIALLIRPLEPGPPNAGIFVWEDGDIDRRQSAQLFPFESATLRLEGPIEGTPVEPVIKRARKKAIRFPAIPKPVLGWSIAAVAALLLVAGGLETARRLGATPERFSATRPLNLQMRKKGDAVTIDWDRKATSLQTASSAVLTIRDGAEEQKLTLGRGDLQHGNVQFWPRSTDIAVKMKVGETKTENSSPVAEPPIPKTAALAPKVGQAAAPPNSVARALPYVKTSEKSPVVVALYKDDERDARPTLPEQRPLLPAPPLTGPKAERDQRTGTGLEPNPLPLMARAEPRNTAPESVKVSRGAARPGVAVSVRLEQRGSGDIRKVISHVPLLGRTFHGEGGNNYSAARPVRPLEPRVPESLARYVVGYVDVDVRLSLDKHGAVRNAEILSGQGSELAGLAANSATSAMWEPAYEGDHPVASDIVVHYRFQSRD